MSELPIQDLLYIQSQTGDICRELNCRKILLTGGTGFFGKWILESLLFVKTNLSIDIKIFVLSRDPERFAIQYPHLVKDKAVTFLKGDVTDFNFPKLEADYIIHAATEASAQLNAGHPLIMMDSIIKGTRNVLEFARKENVGHLLYISSGAVYGIQPEGLKGFHEDYNGSPNPLLPASAYAEAKRTAELLCACYSSQYQIHIPVARCFAFVGPYLNLDAHFAIGNFIRDGLNGENIVIKGDGKPLRSYMYASDLVVWLLKIMMYGKSSEAYNVGSDEAISVKQLALTVAGHFKELKIQILNQVKPSDRNQDYVPDVSKTRREFGLNSIIGLDQAIDKTIKYYRRQND